MQAVPAGRGARARRLGIEALEDRSVPASLIADINPATLPADPVLFTDVNGTAFFFADNGTTGRELWKTDGTAAGTALVKDIRPGTGSGNPTGLTDVNGTLYFVATTPTTGRELYKIVGGAPVLVEDISPGAADGFNVGTGYGIELVLKDDELFFAADDGTTGTELWSITV